MLSRPEIRVIIPAHNEEHSIGRVLKDIPKNLVSEIIVINNASTDDTAKVATEMGATVLNENIPGYGRACLMGLTYLTTYFPQTDIVVFIDGDYSDFPEEMVDLINPILQNDIDLVIGSRTLGKKEKGSMTPQQIFGNWLATRLLKWFYNVKFTDLGPFRAIKFSKLTQLNMVDTTYGWTVEMQVKAARQRLKTTEIPVRYRKRIGKSKISGTLKGTILAGYKIIFTILKHTR